MNLSLAVLVYMGAATNHHQARSAMPDAPVVAQHCSGPLGARLDQFRGRAASLLHRAAWAIEPVSAPID